MPRAALYRAFGDSSVLEIADVPLPEPGPGEIRVRVEYSSVNPVDSKMRAGVLSDGAPLAGPAITGMDIAGTIDALGPGVEGLSIGDRVAGLSPNGAAAEFVVTYAAAVVPVPETVPAEVAATIGVGGSTAVRALGLAEVGAGSLILVDGATGGVGTFLTQLAVARGASVVGTASAANLGHLRDLGATAIDYAGDWEAAAREAAGERDFDAAFDLSTGGKFDALAALTGSPATVVTLVDPEVPANGGIIVTGMEPGFETALSEVMDGLEAGDIRVPIARTFPLSEIAAAQDLSAAGHVRGKLLIDIAG